MHAELRQEFNSFIPPGAISVQDNDVEQSRYGLVGESYTTSLTFEDVRKHYEKQLVEKGYTFKEALPVKDWGKDYGEEVVHYCKGDRMASIYKPGHSPNRLKYQFSFSLSGNAFECRSFFKF